MCTMSSSTYTITCGIAGASLSHLQLRVAGCNDWPKCRHLAMLASTSEGTDARRSKEPVLNSLAAKIAVLNSLFWMDRRKALIVLSCISISIISVSIGITSITISNSNTTITSLSHSG